MAAYVAFVSWYRRADYDHVRKMMGDRANFPDTFDEWEEIANDQLASAQAQGLVVEKVILDPAEFAAWCAKAKVKPDHKARIAFANDRRWHQQRGHA